MTNWSLWNNIR